MTNSVNIEQYYTAHRDELLAYVSSRLHGGSVAEDIVQEVFLRILDRCDIVTPATLPSLAYTTAHHLVCDHYRRHCHREAYEHYLKTTVSSADDGLSLLSVEDITNQLEHSLARLPEPCRQVYRMHIYEGKQVGDISRELGQSYKAVEYRLGQARKEVRKHLKKIS